MNSNPPASRWRAFTFCYRICCPTPTGKGCDQGEFRASRNLNEINHNGTIAHARGRNSANCKTVYTSSILVVASINPFKRLAAISEFDGDACLSVWDLAGTSHVSSPADRGASPSVRWRGVARCPVALRSRCAVGSSCGLDADGWPTLAAPGCRCGYRQTTHIPPANRSTLRLNFGERRYGVRA